MTEKTLAELAEIVGGKVKGDPKKIIKGVSTLETAGPEQITFLSNKKYEPMLQNTKAGAVIITQPPDIEKNYIIAEDPYFALMQIIVNLHGYRKHENLGVTAEKPIAESAKIAEKTRLIGSVTICSNTTIGKGCVIYPGVFIGPDVKIGNDCIIYPNAAIYDKTTIGSRVIIQANAAIGQDGFGFAPYQGKNYKIPQIGKVILEDDVEIGACAAIERGTLDDTIISKGCKIGDLVAVGHGAKIGPHCLLVPQVGVAGSATIGHHCVFGGQAGITGHIKIGNMVKAAAQAGIINNIPDGTEILGAPAIDANLGKRAYSLIQYLPDFRKKIKKLEKRIDSLAADKNKNKQKN